MFKPKVLIILAVITMFFIVMDNLGQLYTFISEIRLLQPHKEELNWSQQTKREKKEQTFKNAANPSNRQHGRTQYRCLRPSLVTSTLDSNGYILNTNLGQIAPQLLPEFILRLDNVFRFQTEVLGLPFKGDVTLDIMFFKTRKEYENYILALNYSPYGSTGLYIPDKRLSLVQITTNEQAINIAIHEAIHAVNHAYWGYTLKFVNEGMAEFFKTLSANMTRNIYDIGPISEQVFPVDVTVLLYSETDWHKPSNYELYENSKALFHFFMSNEMGRKVIVEVLNRESVEPCSVLEPDEFLTIASDIYPSYQQDFDYWFTDLRFTFFEQK